MNQPALSIAVRKALSIRIQYSKQVRAFRVYSTLSCLLFVNTVMKIC